MICCTNVFSILLIHIHRSHDGEAGTGTGEGIEGSDPAPTDEAASGDGGDATCRGGSVLFGTAGAATATGGAATGTGKGGNASATAGWALFGTAGAATVTGGAAVPAVPMPRWDATGAGQPVGADTGADDTATLGH